MNGKGASMHIPEKVLQLLDAEWQRVKDEPEHMMRGNRIDFARWLLLQALIEHRERAG
jgi:hypothetical protein